MSRDDLVTTNEKIVGAVTEPRSPQSPDAILIVVSNPLDAMCHVAKNVSGWPEGARLRPWPGSSTRRASQTFIAWETGSSVKDVQATVLGGHGDQMVSVVSATTVGGVPLRKLVVRRIESAMLVERTAKGGGEVVEAARHVGLVRARRGGGADGRRDHARREARRSRAPPTSRASTGSTASTWASRSSSAPAGSRRSSSST